MQFHPHELFTIINKSKTAWALHTCTLGLGRYSQYRYTIDTEVDRYVSIRSSCCIDTSGGIISHFHTAKDLKHIEFDLNNVERILCKQNNGTDYIGDQFALALVFVGFTA